MIIGVTGTTKIGKTTFINDFTDKFKKYQLIGESYRDLPDLDLYESGTEESQRVIRDYMFKQAQKVWQMRDTQRHLIHDRTLLDNLVCTMYLYSLGKISDQFLVESFAITKKSMAFYHMIYFLPITKHSKIDVPDSIDMDYRSAIDVIFKMIYNSYTNRDALSYDIFPDRNCSAIEEVFGSREERIAFVSMILNDEGCIDDIEPPTLPDGCELYDDKGQELNVANSENEYSIEDFGSFEDPSVLLDSSTNFKDEVKTIKI